MAAGALHLALRAGTGGAAFPAVQDAERPQQFQGQSGNYCQDDQLS